MYVCKVVWNGDEAKITFSKEFLDADWLIKADALTDIKYDVEQFYEKTMKERRYAESNSRTKN